MRSWMAAVMVCALSPAAGAMAQGDVRAVADDPWCRDQREDGDDRARTCIVYEGSWPAAGTIAVDARPNGGIELRGSQGSEVRLRAKVVAVAEDAAAARALASQVRIQTGRAVRADGPAQAERGSRSWWSVSYRLEVPAASSVTLESTNGGIHVSDVTGDIAVQTTNGGLHLSRVGGHVSGRTTNGGVHVQLEGTEWRGAGLDVSTTNGGVHLSVPSGYNARLETSTTNGRVHGDLPSVEGRDEERASMRRGRQRGRRHVSVELGRGGAPIRVRTTNGSVHVDTR